MCWFWGCKQYYLPFLSFLFSPFHSGRARASLSRSRPFRGQRVKFKVRMVAPETTMHLHTLHSDRTVFFRCTTVYPPCRFLQPGIIAYDLPSLPPLHAVWHALLTSGLCSLESQLDVKFLVLWFRNLCLAVFETVLYASRFIGPEEHFCFWSCLTM